MTWRRPAAHFRVAAVHGCTKSLPSTAISSDAAVGAVDLRANDGGGDRVPRELLDVVRETEALHRVDGPIGAIPRAGRSGHVSARVGGQHAGQVRRTDHVEGRESSRERLAVAEREAAHEQLVPASSGIATGVACCHSGPCMT